MPYAIQVLETGKPRSLRRWLTVSTAKRLKPAERILASVRQDRLHVATLSRIKPFNGELCRAYHLSEDEPHEHDAAAFATSREAQRKPYHRP